MSCLKLKFSFFSMALLELGEHLMSRKGMLPSLSGGSKVNLMWAQEGAVLKDLYTKLCPQGKQPTSAIYQHSSTQNHPKADILQFKFIDQDSKQVSREARKAIHIRRTNPAPNSNIGKMCIPNIFNQLLGTINNPSADISTNFNILHNPLTISSIRSTRAVYLHN